MLCCWTGLANGNSNSAWAGSCFFWSVVIVVRQICERRKRESFSREQRRDLFQRYFAHKLSVGFRQSRDVGRVRGRTLWSRCGRR